MILHVWQVDDGSPIQKAKTHNLNTHKPCAACTFKFDVWLLNQTIQFQDPLIHWNSEGLKMAVLKKVLKTFKKSFF
jgi:hypothetical protein